MRELFLILLTVISINAFPESKKGLMIVAHGSPSPMWNTSVEKIKQNIKEEFKRQGIIAFHDVRIAMMEFAKPTINDVVEIFEEEGCEELFVIPLFISPSGHSLVDIPNILGLKYNSDIVKSLKEEGIEIVNSKMKIRIMPELNYHTYLHEILLDRVKKYSNNSSEEAVVLLSHGDRKYEGIWNSLNKKVGQYIMAKTGIEYFDNAYVEVGQSFATKGMSSILKASNNKKRVIVIGMYVSLSVKRLVESSGIIFRGHKVDCQSMLEGRDVIFDNSGVVNDKRIISWIVDRAKEILKK